MARNSVHGFAAVEAAAVLVVLALTVALALPLALPLASGARSAGWDAVDAENLHRFAAATGSYAADNADKYWTFSWQGGTDLPTDYNDLKSQNANDNTASAAQAVDILRRKAGRVDIPVITAWFAQPFYSHLPLYDFMDEAMPALWGVCPADRHRQDWAKDPLGFDMGEFLPCQPAPSGSNKRWPYSSSYELSTSFHDQSAVQNRVSQAGDDSTYNIPGNADLHGRRLGETAFPSKKVHLYESTQHHFDEGAGADCDDSLRFFLPDARTAMLFADGHSGLMKTSEANPGWQPNNPMSPNPTYLPDGKGGYVPGVYRWTREFLGGRDFGGPEVGPPP